MDGAARTEPLIGWAAAALATAMAGSWAFEAATSSEASFALQLVHDVLVFCLLGAAVLVSFVACVRIVTSSAQHRGLPVAVVLCLASIGYVVGVFVPRFMDSVARSRPETSAEASSSETGPSACRVVAPMVSRWLAEDRELEADRRAPGVSASDVAGARARELAAWLRDFRQLELPARLREEAAGVDRAVHELRQLWAARANAPSRTSTSAVSAAQTAATARIRALSAACVE